MGIYFDVERNGIYRYARVKRDDREIDFAGIVHYNLIPSFWHIEPPQTGGLCPYTYGPQPHHQRTDRLYGPVDWALYL